MDCALLRENSSVMIFISSMAADVDEKVVLVSFILPPRSVARSKMWIKNVCTFGTQALILKLASKSLSNHHVSIRDNY